MYASIYPRNLAVGAIRLVANRFFDLLTGVLGNLVGDIVAAGDMFSYFVYNGVDDIVGLIHNSIYDVVGLVDSFTNFFLDTVKEGHQEHLSPWNITNILASDVRSKGGKDNNRRRMYRAAGCSNYSHC